ncbi:MAG TPA: MBL fold metallo-hydrolase [Gemmatimonadaceae bacterium]|nr:MBL fold metallo-hydrolase [Gemmatimonadaceae bacterium]
MGASTFRVAMGRCVIAGIMAGIMAAASVDSVRAQGVASYASVLTYRTVRVADGVYAFITPEERTGFQSGNSIVIIGDSSVLVFDTGNIPGSTRRQIADIRKLTNKPVRFVVNSHWHPDHNLGNIEYRSAFPGVTIIGTTATRAGILERVPTYIGQMKSFAQTDSLMRLRLSTGRMRDSSKMPDSTRLVWGIYTRDYAEFMPEVLKTTPSPPDLICDDSLTLVLGNRRVKIVSPGRGNTAGDTYVYLPDEHVLLTGDLVTFPGPFPGTAFFGDWIRDLDALKALHASVIVPGHGDVQHDYAYIDMVRELLVFTRDRARDAVLRGVPLDSAQKQIDFAPFIKSFTRGDVVRRQAFENFYPFPAVQRAYEEASFEIQGAIPKPGK